MATTVLSSAAVSGSSPSIRADRTRNTAVDAYRGFVMLLMMGEVMSFSKVAHAFPGNPFWNVLGFNQSHVEWAGCSLHDMIQPSFSFLVGVVLPYSLASRRAKGAAFPTILGHTVWRSFLLVALGIFLRSMYAPLTNFTFEDTLTQIGLGFTFLTLSGFCRERWQWSALGVILFGYWLAWAIYPAPGPAFKYADVGVPADWHHNFTGFASHWNKNSNLGLAFDQWFLNIFPRTSPFVANDGGYLTLSFIPTLGTMILGLIAGTWMRSTTPQIPLKKFLTAGALCIAAGLLLHVTGVCPIVKRIWTPAWTLFSGGVCFLFLSAFCWVIEVKAEKKWAFPLIVVGMNSIAAYLIAHLFEDFIISSLHTHLGTNTFAILGAGLEPLVLGITVLAIDWLMLYWMYQRKIFLRI
jgi:heparan-alpha-glucosaminide N-acetyltransferase